jgi:hypothetical protein
VVVSYEGVGCMKSRERGFRVPGFWGSGGVFLLLGPVFVAF